jgi:DNA polymerase-4
MRKSLGAETTFARDLVAWEEVGPALEPVFAKLWAAYRRHSLTARTVTVKIKYANFRLITRSRSCSEAVTSQASIEQLSLDLLHPLFPPPRGVRLLALRCQNFDAVEAGENRHQRSRWDSRAAAFTQAGGPECGLRLAAEVPCLLAERLAQTARP